MKRKSEQQFEEFATSNKENIERLKKQQESSLAKDQKIIEVR